MGHLSSSGSASFGRFVSVVRGVVFRRRRNDCRRRSVVFRGRGRDDLGRRHVSHRVPRARAFYAASRAVKVYWFFHYYALWSHEVSRGASVHCGMLFATASGVWDGRAARGRGQTIDRSIFELP